MVSAAPPTAATTAGTPKCCASIDTFGNPSTREVSKNTVMEDHTERNAPLRRNISAEDVGNAALYLCGPLAQNVTGQILLVDAGYSILGMPHVTG